MTEEEVTTKWLDLEFYVYEHVNLGWSEVGGLYVFAGQRLDDSGILRWHPLYVGKTQDFSARLPTHERWPEAVQAGATQPSPCCAREELTRTLPGTDPSSDRSDRASCFAGGIGPSMLELSRWRRSGRHLKRN